MMDGIYFQKQASRANAADAAHHDIVGQGIFGELSDGGRHSKTLNHVFRDGSTEADLMPPLGHTFEHARRFKAQAAEAKQSNLPTTYEDDERFDLNGSDWQGGAPQVAEPCRKCSGLASSHKRDKKKFFMELEHTRRGVTKMLEQLSFLMSGPAYQAFVGSLQLDVRYLSNHDEEEEDEETPKPTQTACRPRLSSGKVPPAASRDLKAEIAAEMTQAESDQKDQIIKRLEAALEAAEEEMRNLKLEVRKKEEVSKFSAPVQSTEPQAGSSLQRSVQTTERSVQTTQTGESPEPFGPGSTAAAAAAEIEKQKKIKESEEAGSSASKAGRKKGAAGKSDVGGTGGTGSAPGEDLEKLQSERDYLAKWRKETEKKLKELEAELAAKVKRMLEMEQTDAAHLRELEDMRARVGTLEKVLISNGIDPAAIIPAHTSSALRSLPPKALAGKQAACPVGKSSEAPNGDGMPTASGAATAPRDRRNYSGMPDQQGSNEATRGVGPSGGAEPRERGGNRRGGRLDDGEIPVVMKVHACVGTEKDFASCDACVGPGPGYGLQDAPCQMAGKGMQKSFVSAPELRNTNPNAFSKEVRKIPNLAAAAFAVMRSSEKNSIGGKAQTPPLRSNILTSGSPLESLTSASALESLPSKSPSEASWSNTNLSPAGSSPATHSVAESVASSGASTTLPSRGPRALTRQSVSMTDTRSNGQGESLTRTRRKRDSLKANVANFKCDDPSDGPPELTEGYLANLQANAQSYVQTQRKRDSISAAMGGAGNVPATPLSRVSEGPRSPPWSAYTRDSGEMGRSQNGFHGSQNIAEWL